MVRKMSSDGAIEDNSFSPVTEQEKAENEGIDEQPPKKHYPGKVVRNTHTGRKMHMVACYPNRVCGVPEGVYSDAYDDLIKRLVWRVQNDMQNVIIVDGETGSGKSAFALNLCLDLAKALNVGFDLSKDYIYDLGDLWNKLDDEDANPINLLDEGTVTISSSNAQQKQDKQFATLLDTMRSKHWTTIICTPSYRRVNSVVRKIHAEFKCRCYPETKPLVKGYGRGFFEMRRRRKYEFDTDGEEPRWKLMYAGIFGDYPPMLRDEYLAIKANRQNVLTKRYIQEAKLSDAKTQKELDKYLADGEDKGMW